GVLVEFASAVNAVECGAELQRRVADATKDWAAGRRIVLRVGINVGDVVVEGSDLYGDGVNIAARLESLADPGEVFVSVSVYGQVRRKCAAGLDGLGRQSVKSLAEPVLVFRLRRADEACAGALGPLELPAKPSIAVLPFTNMGGEPEQEVFADGMTED